MRKSNTMGQIGDNGQNHFIDSILSNNQLDHITRLIGFHPQYLDPFLRTKHFILKGDGPLPYVHRHFIAIMAAARHQCAFLVEQQKQEFLHQGGDIKWLEGLENVPKKLRNLNETTKLLAHRPWLISKSHIEKLTKGKENWSLSELVQAIIIVTHFHALSSFVFGCGLHAEIDADDSIIVTEQSPTNDAICQEGGVEELMKKMKMILEDQKEQMSQEELVKRYEKVESQSAELSPKRRAALVPKGYMVKLIDDPNYTYEDFSKRGEPSKIPTFRVQDYSWDHHGYSLVNRLYNDVGTLLDEKFKVAYNLTYYSMGRKKNVDTSMFRIAVWNYIQCMYGIRHDDYDYREVNELLERNLKAYIKTVCCFPERTTKSDFDNVMKEFAHSEKIHVNLMVIEAKFQAELLYALRAVMNYMT